MTKPSLSIPPQVLSGDTADVYFVRTLEVLQREGINPRVTMEVFSSGPGVLCGMEEVKALLERVLPPNSQAWALAEGEFMERKEVALRITAPYQSFCLYETAYLGIMAHCSGWATAARECVEAAQGKPIISFGARHVHPAVAPIMDYAAAVGGCQGCSTTGGARLMGGQPIGTMPHALILTMGDTVDAVLAFDRHMPPDVPRIALVDTFKDEVEESIRVAQALGDRLEGVRLDTPPERGRVTMDLVKEVRAKLDLAGFPKVRIVVSGGLNPERIRAFMEAGALVDVFAVGSYISDAAPIDFTADLHEVEGKPVAKRGRLPGITPNPRLKRIL
ncbi:MAG: nicotinate phosphoribosyltransferase [Chloroflexi bacterium]|nr:nicotinate phosphoribosyltransferase [Chloroflexota bacterium]